MRSERHEAVYHPPASGRTPPLAPRVARGAAAALLGIGAALVLATLSLPGCASDPAPPAAPSAPEPSAGLPGSGSPRRGVRLVYEPAEPGAGPLYAALGALRARLDSLGGGLELSVRASEGAIVVEIGPEPAATLARIKEAIAAPSGLGVAPLLDEGDPLGALGASPPPSGLTLDHEHVALPGGSVRVQFARTPEGPSRGDAAARLLAWVKTAPAAQHVVVGPTTIDDEPYLRTYVLSSPPKTLEVTDVEAVRGASGAPELRIALSPRSALDLEAVTRAAARRRIALLVGAEVKMAPIVMEPITGGIVHVTFGSGAASRDEAERAAAGMRLPALPVRLTLLREELFDRAKDAGSR